MTNLELGNLGIEYIEQCPKERHSKPLAQSKLSTKLPFQPLTTNPTPNPIRHNV